MKDNIEMINQKHCCLDCGKQLKNFYAKRCLHCSGVYRYNLGITILNKGTGKRNNSLNWKGGKPKCKICNKQLSDYGCKECSHCSKIGEKNNNFKDGIYSQQLYCLDCGKKLSNNRVKRCYRCNIINIWKYNRNKMTNAILKGLKLKPNKPEKILKKLLPKNFKYVGNGKLIINGFNPDFIDKKNKKIIELYGDYWHNRPEIIKRDKRRIACYLQNNYKVLIIWENELKNLNKLIYKIYNYDKTN